MNKKFVYKSTYIFIECGYFFYGINGMSDIIVIYVLSEYSLNE